MLAVLLFFAYTLFKKITMLIGCVAIYAMVTNQDVNLLLMDLLEITIQVVVTFYTHANELSNTIDIKV
ncbi:hypothetical protein [Vibrio cincinnatiensis]|uniref:hypothetical protein n=1 Tax=Vibrio cincinnatiensis TaxID=675 RepID=UPI001EDE183D|nr:hypothetical protein [Vibrio cincinnatiensis]MCG3734184.1 hypothetical protein [Vibrio cincinnatiensis]MCG3741317.1 hypothetical protein [Vibrio cincinnatiensis]MCG3744818.1 hypothetical protein [Vibrio cincinnatiensis]MCG3760661.1 hypothetical protein [Vibrio cincinnatiensis]MCG3763966.1 hypothetical protein [Vibrio cincinnatiensis]